MSFDLKPDLHYGWFAIPDKHNVYIYIKELDENKPGDVPYVLDAIFQLVHILGQTLPHDVDVWVDFDNKPPVPRFKIIPLRLVEEHPIDQMHKYLGTVAQVFFPLAKLILYTHSNLSKVE